MYRERGIIHGFYAGFLPNYVRCVLKLPLLIDSIDSSTVGQWWFSFPTNTTPLSVAPFSLKHSPALRSAPLSHSSSALSNVSRPSRWHASHSKCRESALCTSTRVSAYKPHVKSYHGFPSFTGTTVFGTPSKEATVPRHSPHSKSWQVPYSAVSWTLPSVPLCHIMTSSSLRYHQDTLPNGIQRQLPKPIPFRGLLTNLQATWLGRTLFGLVDANSCLLRLGVTHYPIDGLPWTYSWSVLTSS